jgi:bacterioferritin-associated ferredoxin
MLVCSCNRVDHHSIEAEADRQLASDPSRTPSPARIYLAIGERPRCGGCFPLAEKIIASRKPAYDTCESETG